MTQSSKSAKAPLNMGLHANQLIDDQILIMLTLPPKTKTFYIIQWFIKFQHENEFAVVY